MENVGEEVEGRLKDWKGVIRKEIVGKGEGKQVGGMERRREGW